MYNSPYVGQKLSEIGPIITEIKELMDDGDGRLGKPTSTTCSSHILHVAVVADPIKEG